MSDLVPGGTSTGSKRRAALVGAEEAPEFPVRYSSASGARVLDERGVAFLDWTMALGAVGLGYAHPEVVKAVSHAVHQGNVGPVPHRLEARLAERLVDLYQPFDQVQFLKTGAEAVAAAVRIARRATGRSPVWYCGYHGWLDWCSPGPGVPAVNGELARQFRFDDIGALEQIAVGPGPAAIIIEPVVDGYPSRDWLVALRELADRLGAVLVFDEIKTGFRLGLGGAAQKFSVAPDMAVLGKALANGFPIAAVGGSKQVMEAASDVWISSTLAGETAGIAAALATLEVMQRHDVPGHLQRVGSLLFDGLEDLASRYQLQVAGVPVMCYLRSQNGDPLWSLTAGMARHRILWKATAYNFVSLAHGEPEVGRTLAALEECLATGSAE